MSGEIDADAVLTCLKTAVTRARTEEDLRVRVSACIEERILRPLGLDSGGFYEYTFVSGGRADALYGHVIIEYKRPGRLSSEADVARAKEQIVKYIMGLAGSKDRYREYLGVIISDRIAFVRYNPAADRWVLRGPYDISRGTVVKLIEALRGLKRKRLGVEELLSDFGKSPLARRAVRAFYRKLVSSGNPRVRMLFDDWRRLFTQATGYDPKKLRGLEREYGLEGEDVDYDALLFAIHTYYALIMKLLAAEIAYLYGAGPWLKSYVAELEDAYMRGLPELRRVLGDLESGGIFKRLLGITNFIEGDYFSWYLDVLDEELAEVVAEIARKLSQYEPATPQLEPEETRDLLKRLYQHLVPQRIRHDLGEYYTPDWLAELVLDEVGFTEERFEELGRDDPTAPFRLRLLDPAAGSGTFLVLALRRLRGYAEKHFLTDLVAEYALRNIVGYDLNPLAVLAARTNYLLAVADLLPHVRGEREIPVYLADSILVEAREWEGGYRRPRYIIRTVAGEFEIPKPVVDAGLLGELLSLLEAGVRGLLGPEEFINAFKRRIVPALGGDDGIDYGSLRGLYERLLDLERRGRDRVWISIIRNAFAPILQGRFDYVVGNPPWVNWESLPEAYRRASDALWRRYGLVPPRRGAPGLGRVKRDLSMLFTVRSIDLYLREGGRLGFLITYTVFVSQAGSGFRRFFAQGRQLRDGRVLAARVLRVHDLEELQPFEGASNRAAALIAEKGVTTQFPIEAIRWHGSRRRLPTDISLAEALQLTERERVYMVPLVPGRPESQWIEVPHPELVGVLRRIVGREGPYRAHAGVYTGLNSVYFVRIEGRRDGLLLVRNLVGGRRSVEQVEALVEESLVYPLVRGRDLDKWTVRPSGASIILPVDEAGEPIPHERMKQEYPHAWEYFLRFFDQLVDRRGEPYKTALRPYRELRARGKSIYEVLRAVPRPAPPFYYVFNAKPSLAPYKVAWKEVTSRLTKYGFTATVIGPAPDGRPRVPDHTVVFIPVQSEDEAHYLAGILNSTVIRLATLYTVASSIQNLNIPRYDPSNPDHQRIAQLSRQAHQAASTGDTTALRGIEEKIDTLAAKLLGVTPEELQTVKRTIKNT